MKNWKPSGLQLYWVEIPAPVFSCEYCEIFQNTYFEEHLRTAASKSMEPLQFQVNQIYEAMFYLK